ncbi:MAG: response regulator [Spirochaetales bacterium]|nr:response regulator [Spirochaetales bacterium]
MLVKKALEPEGYTVLEAENGKEALSHKDIAGADLFLVDVNMPQMNGFELVKNIKQDTRLSSKPVIFLTTESALEKKNEGKDLGGAGWIVKPFEPPALIKVIKMFS